jgi:predicted membrane metal-binding protein
VSRTIFHSASPSGAHVVLFAGLKTVALMRKQRHRGLARVRWVFIFAVALYNLVRIRNIEAVT